MIIGFCVFRHDERTEWLLRGLREANEIKKI